MNLYLWDGNFVTMSVGTRSVEAVSMGIVSVEWYLELCLWNCISGMVTVDLYL